MVGYLECPLFQALYIPNINTYRMHRIRGVMQTLTEKKCSYYSQSVETVIEKQFITFKFDFNLFKLLTYIHV